ncbi:phosphopantothenoylcysteine decarboxylase [Halobaculum sp. MBLA0147]|uniref:phosphopantothenoylcysteine decarboxylase domain-containing protein n=1 Tax=Halobaculum sp. MBLA0147 TaxID=3079934 RepID=UPI00352618A8
MLADTNVALGITGSIAAVKTVELAHELRRHGAAVRGVTTESARGILHPWAVEFATDRPVVTEITGAVEHVELCGRDGWADVLLVAPATANTVGKIAAAIDDSPVTTCATTALGAGVPTVVVPAMHEPMYDHPGVSEALDTLGSWGVRFVDPRIEEGKAKIASEADVVTETARAAATVGAGVGATVPSARGDDATETGSDTGSGTTAGETAPSEAPPSAGRGPLAGRHVVVTAGATSESVDPIRVLTNRASGRTGRAVARACYAAGATVTLVHDGPAVQWADTRRVESAAEMTAAVLDACDERAVDALVSAAAIADYTPTAADEKIRSGQASLTLELAPTPKLIDEVRDRHPSLPIVGFKAETEGDDEALVARARETLTRAELAFVVANDASVMREAETRTLFVRDPETPVAEFVGTKGALGTRVAAELAREFRGDAE